jgi:hypothetical protein
MRKRQGRLQHGAFFLRFSLNKGAIDSQSIIFDISVFDTQKACNYHHKEEMKNVVHQN